MLTLYGLLQLISNFIAWILPIDEQAKYQFVRLATWRVWLVATPILTLIIIALIVRSALRVIAERDARHAAEISKLNEESSGKISALQTKLDALTEHKLKFEIDAPRSKVDVSYAHGDEGYSLGLAIFIRFINADIHTLIVQSVNVSLIKLNEDNTESEIVKIGQGLSEMTYDEESTAGWKLKSWDNIDLPISGREQTLYHPIRGYIDVAGESAEMFNSSCFLRVCMEAMNQPPYRRDFNIKWGNLSGWLDITPRT